MSENHLPFVGSKDHISKFTKVKFNTNAFFCWFTSPPQAEAEKCAADIHIANIPFEYFTILRFVLSTAFLKEPTLALTLQMVYHKFSNKNWYWNIGKYSPLCCSEFLSFWEKCSCHSFIISKHLNSAVLPSVVRLLSMKFKTYSRFFKLKA